MVRHLLLGVCLSLTLAVPWARSSPVASQTLPQGDINGDGKVSRADFVYLRNTLLGQHTLTTDQKTHADLNGDALVNIADLIKLVGLIEDAITISVTPDAGTWKLTGPAGFTTLNGKGDRLGTNAITEAPAGTYRLHCNPLSGYTAPADLVLRLSQRGLLAFEPSYAFTPTSNGAVEMVSITAGTFPMGRSESGDDAKYGTPQELPRHWVTLSAYQIGKYEVTNGQYCAMLNWALGKGYLKDASGGAYGGGVIYAEGHALLYINDGFCQIQYSGGKFSCVTQAGANDVNYSMENHPVVSVTWHGCVAFCNWLSEKEGLEPCYYNTWGLRFPYTNGYRLPTEAEWERAAAWDGSKHWIYGFQSDTLKDFSRCNCTSGTRANPLGLDSYPFTSPVGWFNGINTSPNGNVRTVNSISPAGCYDMSGNAWEWCQDWYGVYGSGPAINPTGPATGSNHVIRGGGGPFEGAYGRSAYRTSDPNPWYPEDIGFRLARTP